MRYQLSEAVYLVGRFQSGRAYASTTGALVAATSPATLVRSDPGGSFLADGWAIGMKFRMRGTPSNDGDRTISTVDATTITTVEQNIVTEGATAGVILGGEVVTRVIDLPLEQNMAVNVLSAKELTSLSAGLYVWPTSHITTPPASIKSLHYVMHDLVSGHIQDGKFVVGGYPESIDTAISSRATQAQILSDATPFPGGNINASIGSRAQPGDAMDLVAAAINGVRDAILDDATRFSGGKIDVSIGSRAAPGDAMDLVIAAVNGIRDAILSDATPFPGGNIDDLITSRAASGDQMDLIPDRLQDLQRLYTGNQEFTSYFATAPTGSPRNVPTGGLSHIRIRIKLNTDADWSSPVITDWFVYTYKIGAEATDAPRSSLKQNIQPTDGTFETTLPQTG